MENIYLRCRSCVDVSFEYSTDKDILKDNLTCEIETYQEKIKSDIAVFHVQRSRLLFHVLEPQYARPIAINPDEPCKKLRTHIEPGDGDSVAAKSKSRSVVDPIDVSLLFLTTGSEAVQRVPPCAPIIHHEHREFKNISIVLPIDVLVKVGPEEPVSCLSNLLAEGVSSQLSEMMECLWTYRQDETFQCPQVFHYLLKDNFVSVMYPAKQTEEELESVRKELHEKYNLPMDRPLLRRCNAYSFLSDVKSGGYLTNPHIGLPPSGVKDGGVHLVYGRYNYHHYMQDKFDDNHWGCAYRSLQTLMSWFRLQGYTDKAIPSHRDIQQALVDIGDKEPSFVGARKWIGSMEVGFCLDHLLGVSYKILNVSSGAELASKGRELAVHFDTQGTPIMIGGGVLAHTILGVDFNDVTGDLKFLILDPHYTGAEDLKTIQDKGWCGWKGPSFWDQRAYYNLCMPQRPNLI